jgi:signal transduction histidine kinase
MRRGNAFGSVPHRDRTASGAVPLGSPQTAARARTGVGAPAASPGRRLATLALLMVLAIATVGALAFWDERRESAAALDDFAEEQGTLAASVASELSTRLAQARRGVLAVAEALEEGRPAPSGLVEGATSFQLRDDGEPALSRPGELTLSVPTPSGRRLDLNLPVASLLGGASARIERPGALMVLVLPPGGSALHASDGRVIASDEIRDALGSASGSWLWLDRTDAADLGLPSRRAAAGLARCDAGPLGRWGVAVVSSAVRVRDRESRARWRLVLGVGLAGGLVLAFGSVALRKQRRELVLERELAIADLQQERDDRLAQANHAAVMGTLAMGVAHEVSTPLGIIAGRAEQLAPRVGGDERASRSVQAIVEQAERIRRVVRGFLDLARGGSPDLVRVGAADVVRQAVALVEHRFDRAGVRLATDLSGELPSLRCDASMLEQALVNLLLNACDACAPGGLVRVSAESDGRRVAFTVLDDGVGIGRDAAARALEPFFTTKPAGQGTGLGLAIAHEIVKLHRGKLSLAPAEPRGTRACIEIPLPKADAHAAA